MSSSSDTRDIKAKGSPLCSWCGERIQKGEIYKGWTYFGDDGPSTCKMHVECESAMQRSFNMTHEYEFDLYTSTRGCTCEAGDPGHGSYPHCTPVPVRAPG